MQEPAQSSQVLTPFGKYLLDEEIARGGMARVYLARLRGLGGFEKRLVVKQVRPELASDPRFVSMFVEEAKTLVQMSHPHIVPVYELGIVDGVYFLAMEHVEGATLAEILRDGGALPAALAAHIGVSVCDALEYAHARFELVHRDVTPRNVIVDGLGHVRLLDFGIAAKADGMLKGEVFGSHGYMSPEQMRGEPLGTASDLFSLGTVLYEAIAGEPAFLRADVDDTKRALEGEPPSLADRDGVPEVLATLVAELLRRDPEERPRSARAVGRRLREWLAGARPEGVGPELAQRVESARERRAPTHLDTLPAEPSTDRADPSGVVRSIATSVTLQKLIGTDAPGTVPIPGRAQTAKAAPTVTKGTFPFVTGVVIVAVVGVAWWLGAAEEGRPEGRSPPVQVDVAPAPPAEPEAPAKAPVLATTETATEEAATEITPVEAAAPAIVTVNSTPWSEVRLDGRSVGNTPIRALRVPPGPHVLVLTNPPLRRSAEVRIRPAAGGRTRVIVDLGADPPEITVR